MTFYKHYVGIREYITLFPIGEEIDYDEGMSQLHQQEIDVDKISELMMIEIIKN